MTTTQWIAAAALIWLLLSLAVAVVIGRSINRADRHDDIRRDFESWERELDADD